jgi:hypothetical protein
LWKRFDAACNKAHVVVDAWLKEARAQTAANKAQRLALIEELKTWSAAHAQGPDWKGVARQLHQFAQRWRESGHLSEKMFAELQPQWKAAIHAAHEPLELVQKASLERRNALIAEAQALGAAPSLRIDAVKALQSAGKKKRIPLYWIVASSKNSGTLSANPSTKLSPVNLPCVNRRKQRSRL